MTTYTTITLLPTTTHGVPSGNYNGTSPDFNSDASPAANYYAGQSNLQTIAYTVVNFLGNVTVQATLQNDAPGASWFDIDNYTSGNVVIPSDYHTVSVVGNFSYLRVEVRDFNSGNVTVATSY